MPTITMTPKALSSNKRRSMRMSPPHARGERDHVLVGFEHDVVDRRITAPDDRVRAVEEVRVLEDDLVARLPVGAEDDARREDRELSSVDVAGRPHVVDAHGGGEPGPERVAALAAELDLVAPVVERIGALNVRVDPERREDD